MKCDINVVFNDLLINDFNELVKNVEGLLFYLFSLDVFYFNIKM